MSEWELVEESPQDEWEVVPEEQYNGLLGQYGKYYDLFHKNIGQKYLAPWGASVLETLPNAAASLANAFIEPTTGKRIPHLNLHDFKIGKESVLPEDYSELASILGNFTIPDAGFTKAFVAIKNIPNPKGVPSYLANIVKGAAAGYALGEDSEGSRLIATLLGAAAPAALGITSSSVGNKVLENFKKVKQNFSKEYKSIFDSLNKEGIKRISHEITPKKIKEIESAGFPKYRNSLEKIKNSKNAAPEDIHKAQSDLGKMIRRLKETDAKKGLSFSERETLEKVEKLKDSLVDSLEKGMKGTKAAESYKTISKRYAKEVVPYLEQPGVRRASLKPTQKGYINPERLPKKLNSETGDPFRNAFKGQYPELLLNKLLWNKYVGIGGPGVYAANEAKNFLKNEG